MDFTTLQAEVRSRLIEASAKFFTDAEVKRWLNIGYKDALRRTRWTERQTVVAAVANQYEYNVPSTTSMIKMVRFQDKYKVVPKSYEEFLTIIGADKDSKSTIPEIYTLYPWDKKIRVHPIPSTASPSTAINDGAGISASVTTITVDSTSTFPTHGRVLIDSEQILYYAKTATTLTQCVRGDGRSTAATHADNATVTVGEIAIYNTYMAADLSAGADTPELPEEYHEALIYYATNIGLYKREKYKESREALERYIELVDGGIHQRLMESLDATHQYVQDSDLVEDF